jgi:hypothetical protein
MTQPQTTIALAYRLGSLLRILSLAGDGQQVANKTLEQSGGGEIIDMAADMAGEIIEQLELAEIEARRVEQPDGAVQAH